jgi:anti-sigma regulatory factor (Ser/Thr protein kinase)
MTTTATHTTLIYDGERQYAAEAGGFLRDGLERGHRGLVMAPPSRVDLLRSELGRDADEVVFVEESTAFAPQASNYRVLLDFLADAPGVRSHVVGEQTLTAKTRAELVDYRRLEAASNVVLARRDVDLLCPYDAGSLSADLIDIAMHTHGTVRSDGAVTPNPRFEDPFDVLAELATVVPPPPEATTLDCSSRADVADARRLVHAEGAQAGITPEVVADVALAVTEVVTNALVHGAPPALLHVYDEEATWVCHIQDAGRGPVDPLVGLAPPSEPSEHGYGLWLARQLCAAVDVGNDRTGTHVRLHVRATRN